MKTKLTFKQFLQENILSMKSYLDKKKDSIDKKINNLLDKSNKAIDDNMPRHSKALSALAAKEHEKLKKFNKISKNIEKQQVQEAPLPDDWDKNIYQNRTSFAKQLKYAKERAQQVGTGSSRVAFKIEYQGRPTILKIAKNKKGLAQNEEESQTLNDWYLKKLDLTIPIIDYDEQNEQPTWLHVEFANKAKDSDFKKVCGLTLSQLMTFAAKQAGRHDYFGYTKLPSDINEEQLLENDFVSSLIDYFGNYTHHPLADYNRLANWGVYDGRLVIIDIGLSQDIYNTFYG